MDNQQHHTYSFGSFILDTRQRTFSQDGTPIHLEPKVFNTLKFLVERPNYAVTRDEIKAAVWGADRFLGGTSIDVNISKIRSALGESSDVYIETVTTIGFIFHAE